MSEDVRKINAANFGNLAIEASLQDFGNLAKESHISYKDTALVG